MLTQQAAIAANRFGLGARPRDAAAIGSDPKGWLEEQVASTKRSTPAEASPPESAQVLQKLRDLEVVRQARCAGSRERWPTEEGRGRRQRRRDRVARYRRGRDQAVRPVLARALPRTGQRPAPARDRERSAVHRAARAVLVESLRDLRGQGARRPARRALRAGSDPPARDRQLRRAAARGRAASRDEHLSRQHDVDGREFDGREPRAQPRARRSASTRTSRAKSSSCTRSASTAATRSTTSRNSRRSSRAGRSAARSAPERAAR